MPICSAFPRKKQGTYFMKSFESQSSTPEGFTYETARAKEETLLSRFGKNPKTRALATAFLLATAACGNMESGRENYTEKETRIETREFGGYGIHTKQRVKVDRSGNIIRVLPPSESPYGRSR